MSPEEINALPDRVRRYIHELETVCDPAGDVRELFSLKEENAALRVECSKLVRVVCALRLLYADACRIILTLRAGGDA